MAKPAPRIAFLAAARVVPVVVAAVADHWDDPSALDGWTVGGLAGHFARAVGTVGAYLAEDPPSGGTVLDPAGYFLAARLDDDDVRSGILARGDEMATAGPQALVASMAETVDELTATIEATPDDRLLAVFGGSILSLDDYLVTRLVELVVHHDDLAASVGEPLPPLPGEAVDLAVGTLVAMARRSYGDTAVVRTLARSERAPGSIAVF
ncbi:MAG: maleylpyruvate isomerase N-terminal domain-containing protein [Acidimicrobiia bacterium]